MTTGRPDRASLDDPLHCRSVLSVRHTCLLDLVLAYFWRWNTLLTVGYHALSLSLSVWWVAAGILNRTPLDGWLLAAGTAVIVFLVFILPPPEALHVFSYRTLRVRDIQWSLPWRLFAVSVLAHNEVLDRSRFPVLAALPSFCITSGLLVHATPGGYSRLPRTHTEPSPPQWHGRRCGASQ